MDKTWIIIPAHNEQKEIGKVISKTKKMKYNIIVVDDGSTDNTLMVARKTGIECITYKQNKGKGYAVRKGCDYAVAQGAQNLVLIDSDGQHNPERIPELLKKLKDVDIVFGVRKKRDKMPIIFRIGNWGLGFGIHLLYGIKIKDTQSGFKAFTAEAYKKLRWKSDDYTLESEIIARTGKNKLEYDSVEIETIYLDKKKGTTVKDGIKVGWNMFKWRLRS